MSFDLCTFRSYVISTFGYLTKIILTFWIFRTNVISKFGHFELISFRPSKFSFYAISTHWLFDFMLFRTWHFSVPYYFNHFGHFIKNHFDLWTFRTIVISNLGLFGLISFRTLMVFFDPTSFRPLDISLLVFPTFRQFVLLSFWPSKFSL